MTYVSIIHIYLLTNFYLISPAVVCEGVDAESSGDKLSSNEELFWEKRGISNHSDGKATEDSVKEADQNQQKESTKKSVVVMPDLKSYYITDTSNWINPTAPTKVITLSPTEEMWKEEYELVLKQFTDTMRSAENYQVQKIEKIVNGFTWKKYKNYCDVIRRDTGQVNERMLFHGTKAFQAILDTGFDERYAKNGLYGYGVYFSPLSEKCDLYTDDNQKHMFLCRVALGKVYRAPRMSVYYHPPAGYNSVEGYKVKEGTNDSTEIIVYIGDQVYPEYLITYK